MWQLWSELCARMLCVEYKTRNTDKSRKTDSQCSTIIYWTERNDTCFDVTRSQREIESITDSKPSCGYTSLSTQKLSLFEWQGIVDLIQIFWHWYGLIIFNGISKKSKVWTHLLSEEDDVNIGCLSLCPLWLRTGHRDQGLSLTFLRRVDVEDQDQQHTSTEDSQ